MRSLRPIMVLGASSNAGKTTFVTGLARLFANKQIKTAPFKSQNMSLNSYVTPFGEEIARSTAVQAFAAKQIPSIHMNPILLKSIDDTTSQVIFHGKVEKNLDAQTFFCSDEWYHKKHAVVMKSIDYLKNNFELIIAEGAGSCGEPNFRHRDLVNMGLAHLLGADVYLLVDIDKGGAFSDILGTLRVMELTNPEDKKFIKGFVINKFRGDETLLKPAMELISKETNIPFLGVVPYLPALALEEEDRIQEKTCQNPEIDIAIIYFPHLSNSSDFNPLEEEENVRFRFVRSTDQLGSPDLIILPGTKNVLWDLEYIRKIGLEDAILQLHNTTPLMGICGGLEMMGKTIKDPFHAESQMEAINGMGLLNFETTLKEKKIVRQVCYQPSAENIFKDAGEIQGYEIHRGVLEYGENCLPLHYSNEGIDGIIQKSPFLFGTFIHDIFKNPAFTRMLINQLREKKHLPPLKGPLINPLKTREKQLDNLASLIEKHCPLLINLLLS